MDLKDFNYQYFNYHNTSSEKRQTDGPISLFSTHCTTKLTKSISKRLEAVLPLVINADQTGDIKGRYIGH